MYMIAVDIGSTYVKAALCDIVNMRLEQELKFPTPGRLESKNELVYENRASDFVEIVEEVVRSFSNNYQGIRGILFSTQMHGCVLSHPGLEYDRYISWQDARCLDSMEGAKGSYLDELKRRLPKSKMENTGVCVKPALALCNLFARFESGELARTPKAKVDTLGSYLISSLTGRRVCHITNGAPMGFANILEGTWRRDILKEAKLDFLDLPELVCGFPCCGRWEKNGLSLAVFPDVGDVQASVYGSGARAGDLIANIATAGQLILVEDHYRSGDYEVRPYFDGEFLNVISRMPAGRNLDVQIDYIREVGEKVFHRKLTRGEVWEQLQSCCGEAAKGDTGGLEVDAGFYELPDRLADGKILHINRSNFTIENVINGTIRDFGRLYEHYARTLKGSGEFTGRLIFAGGAVLRNPKLQKAISAALGVQRTQAAPEDEVYMGLLKLACRCAAENGLS